jgi:two-component sensor histidine kinase
MILQPYVENAIRHGLLPLESGEKHLWLTITRRDDCYSISIRDNGIGRAAAKNNDTDARRKSFGMQISSDRLALLSQTVFQDAWVEVLDLSDEAGRPAGTEVRLSFRYGGGNKEDVVSPGL